MAEVHAILNRRESETPSSFRKRCGDFLMYSEFPSAAATGQLAVGRMTLIGDKHLKAHTEWGQAHDSQLPSDVCVIASYAKEEARQELLEINGTQLRRAPINPEMFPRLAHRMGLDEMQNAVKMVKSAHSHDPKNQHWELFLDGCSLGCAVGTDLEAVVRIHKSQVRLAMLSCVNEGGSADLNGLAGLPSKEALTWHPEISREFGREAALARRELVWSADLRAAAEKEGWGLAEVDGELHVYQVQGEVALITDDEEAWAQVAAGKQDHHIMAKTILATKSPFESCRIARFASNARGELVHQRETH